MTTFSPTKDEIELAELLMAATAAEQLVRQIVEKYQDQALQEMHAFAAPEFRSERMGTLDSPILSHKRAHLLSAADFDRYMTLCKEYSHAVGWAPKPPYDCPLIQAECERREFEQLFLSELAKRPQLAHLNKAVATGIRRAVINTALRMTAPFCRSNVAEILQDHPSPSP